MWIVSTDTIFAEALQITLRQAGVSAVITGRVPASATGAQLIVDLDTAELTAPLPAGAWTISRSADRAPRFVRPFLLRAFAAEIAAQNSDAPHSATDGIPSVADAEGDLPFLRLTPDGALLQGKAIPLSPSERALMAMLADAKGECVPTAEIDALWQERGGNTTAVYISYLRKKIQTVTDLNLIKSVRGKGYCLCLPR